MRPEHAEMYLSALAVEKGWITREHMAEAQKIQKREKLTGRRYRHIGRILLEQGLITKTQIDELLFSLGAWCNTRTHLVPV